MVNQVGFYNVDYDQSVIRGSITDKNSDTYWKTYIDKKYIKEQNVEEFIDSNQFGTFLWKTLKDYRLLYKSFWELELEFNWESKNHIWNPENKKEDFHSIIEDYLNTNVEKFILDNDEKNFVNLFNEILVDKIMSPIPFTISPTKGKVKQIIN